MVIPSIPTVADSLGSIRISVGVSAGSGAPNVPPTDPVTLSATYGFGYYDDTGMVGADSPNEARIASWNDATNPDIIGALTNGVPFPTYAAAAGLIVAPSGDDPGYLRNTSGTPERFAFTLPVSNQFGLVVAFRYPLNPTSAYLFAGGNNTRPKLDLGTLATDYWAYETGGGGPDFTAGRGAGDPTDGGWHVFAVCHGANDGQGLTLWMDGKAILAPPNGHKTFALGQVVTAFHASDYLNLIEGYNGTTLDIGAFALAGGNIADHSTAEFGGIMLSMMAKFGVTAIE